MHPIRADAVVERTSGSALQVTRTVSGSARLAFQAWARPELFQRWWAPASFGVTIIAYEADVRAGGTYRLEMGHASSDQTMTFYGRYLDVTPDARIVWTNDEGAEDGPVTTVTCEDHAGNTLVTVHDRYPSKQALDEAMANGSTSGWNEQLRQLDAILRDSGAQP